MINRKTITRKYPAGRKTIAVSDDNGNFSISDYQDSYDNLPTWDDLRGQLDYIQVVADAQLAACSDRQLLSQDAQAFALIKAIASGAAKLNCKVHKY